VRPWGEAMAATTACLEAWQALDLSNVQLALDEQASQVADFREACLASRKELAGRTREFKRRDEVKQAPEDSLLKSEVPPLLRAYQEEVDRLTQRSKFAENCFLAMYRMIREAPDPSKALSAASKQAFEAEAACSAAEQALGECRAELAAERERLAVALAAAEEAAAAAPQPAAGASEAEIRELVEAELGQQYQENLEDLRARSEEELASAAMQLELSQAELERQQERAEDLEKRLAALAAQGGEDGAAGRSGDSAGTPARQPEREARLEEENANLLRDVETAKAAAAAAQGRLAQAEQANAQLQADSEQQTQEMHRVLDEQARQLGDFRRRLAEAPSRDAFDKLKGQLAMIQREMFNAAEDDGDLAAADQGRPASPLDSSAADDGMEAFFVRSTRQLKKELIAAKTAIRELEGQVSELKKTELRLGEALKDQSELTARLEKDLAETQAFSSTRASLPTEARGGLPELTISPMPLTAMPGSSSTAQATGEQEQWQKQEEQQKHQHQALSSMLQAVCAQRDRLRQQLHAAEERADQDRRKIEESERSKKTMEEDNLQLYQRIRFLQNYKVSERSTLLTESVPGAPASAGHVAAADLEAGGSRAVVLSAQGAAKVGGLGRGVEHKYKNLYESDLNPLKAFQQSESKRLYQSMPGTERLALQVCNFFLTRSRGRLFLVVHTVVVHLLLVWCLVL